MPSETKKIIFCRSFIWVMENCMRSTIGMILPIIILIKPLVLRQQKVDLRNEFQVYLAEAKYLKHIPEREKIAFFPKP